MWKEERGDSETRVQEVEIIKKSNLLYNKNTGACLNPKILHTSTGRDTSNTYEGPSSMEVAWLSQNFVFSEEEE